MRARSIAGLVLFGWLATVAAVAAQQVRVEGGAGERAVRHLQSVIERADYAWVERDTLLPADFHVPGDLVIWDSEVRLEGRVDGDVVVLGGTLHVRPGARIGGTMITIRGLALASRLADVGGLVELTPGRSVLFARRADSLVVTIVPPPRADIVALPGLLGLRRISYDRVDGLSVGWGPQLRLTRWEDGPTVDAWATARSARGRLGGGAELALPLPGDVEFVARAERATLTPDAWMRGELSNSLIALAGGHDVRDYHESDRAILMLHRRGRGPVMAGQVRMEPFVAFVHSSDRSLDERQPWGLIGRERLGRENPPVADSLLRSVEVGTRLFWTGAASGLSLRASFEHAPDDLGDVPFSLFSADLWFDTGGLLNDRFNVRTHLRGTVGDSPAPPQRWTHVGGPATLPTLPVAAMRGDQLAFVEANYMLPLPFAELPLVGIPALRMTFATGAAWFSTSEMPRWEQNLGLGFEASFLVAQLFVDPAEPRLRPQLSIGLQIP